MSEPPAATRPPRWVRIINWLSLGCGALGLAWLVSHVGLRTLGERLGEVGGWFALVIAAVAIANTIDARIIQLACSEPGAPLPYRRVLEAQLAGHGVNQVTPGGNLGEVTKITLLMQAGAPRGRAVSGVLLFNVVAVWVNVCVLTVGIPVMVRQAALPAQVEVGLWAAFAVAAGVGLLLALLLLRGGMLAALPRVLARLRVIGPARRQSWTERLAVIDAQLAEFRGARLGDLGRALGMAIVSHLITQTESLLVLHALGVPLPVGFAVALLAAGMLIRWTATVVPFGVGVSEGGNYALFDLLGVAPVMGLVLALAQRARQLVFAALGLGLLAWAQARVRSRRI